MSDPTTSVALATFASRLRALQGIMAKAENHANQTGHSTADYMGIRIAEDMHPFPAQILFTCNQPQNYVAWLRGEERPFVGSDEAPANWEGLQALIAATLEEIDKAEMDNLPAPVEKRINLGAMPMHIMFSPENYFSEWLLPNFYFHLTTTYNLLRMRGVPLGKADFMSYLMPYMRPNA